MEFSPNVEVMGLPFSRGGGVRFQDSPLPGFKCSVFIGVKGSQGVRGWYFTSGLGSSKPETWKPCIRAWSRLGRDIGACTYVAPSQAQIQPASPVRIRVYGFRVPPLSQSQDKP